MKDINSIAPFEEGAYVLESAQFDELITLAENAISYNKPSKALHFLAGARHAHKKLNVPAEIQASVQQHLLAGRARGGSPVSIGQLLGKYMERLEYAMGQSPEWKDELSRQIALEEIQIQALKRLS